MNTFKSHLKYAKLIMQQGIKKNLIQCLKVDGAVPNKRIYKSKHVLKIK